VRELAVAAPASELKLLERVAPVCPADADGTTVVGHSRDAFGSEYASRLQD
jgi:hypothetical protein